MSKHAQGRQGRMATKGVTPNTPLNSLHLWYIAAKFRLAGFKVSRDRRIGNRE